MPGGTMDTKSRIALLVDFDNAQIAAQELQLAHCASSQLRIGPLVRALERTRGGSLESRRCYGHTLLNASRVFAERIWNVQEVRELLSSDLGLQDDLISHGFQMLHCPSTGKKNRADILMALDCMEIATKYEQIDTFA